LNYEDISVGDSREFVRHLTRADVQQFSELTGDTNPLHLDEQYASLTKFGRCIPHGMLIGSLFSTLVGMHLPGKKCLYLSQNLNFKNPGVIDGEVIVRGVVTGKIDAFRILTLQTTVHSGSSILVEGEAKVQFL
jgi:3-hydroxybutyryl-CoA dehydratase